MEEELDSHIEAVEGCKVKASVEHIEGITSKVKERLQSRKKAYPSQSEADRWRDMYKILFPHEEVPTLCKFTFNALQSNFFQEL